MQFPDQYSLKMATNMGFLSFILLRKGTKIYPKVEGLVTQLCTTLCDPMDHSPPVSTVHEILQASILEWVAIPFSRGSSQPRDQTPVSCLVGLFFTIKITIKDGYHNP